VESMESLLAEASANLLFHVRTKVLSAHEGFEMVTCTRRFGALKAACTQRF